MDIVYAYHFGTWTRAAVAYELGCEGGESRIHNQGVEIDWGLQNLNSEISKHNLFSCQKRFSCRSARKDGLGLPLA